MRSGKLLAQSKPDDLIRAFNVNVSTCMVHIWYCETCCITLVPNWLSMLSSVSSMLPCLDSRGCLFEAVRRGRTRWTTEHQQRRSSHCEFISSPVCHLCYWLACHNPIEIFWLWFTWKHSSPSWWNMWRCHEASPVLFRWMPVPYRIVQSFNWKFLMFLMFSS